MDRFFFNFEYWWFPMWNRYYFWKMYAFKNMGAEFNNAWKTKIRPYWKRYVSHPQKSVHKYLYELNGSTDPRYIPHCIFFGNILPYFDEPMYVRQMVDKNLHTLLFPSIKRPETVFKHIKNSFLNDDFTPITKEEAYERLHQEGDYIIKPTRDTGMGADVRFFHAPLTDEQIDELLSLYERKTDYIIQRAVRQHKDLARFNESSLNTIRLVTLVFHDKTYILSTILRVGGKGSHVDNVSKGGYQCTLRPDGDGRLEPLAWTHRDGQGKLVETNDEGLRFGDCIVPNFDKIRNTVIDLATRMPHLKLIGWDIALDEEGEPVLIEFNCQIGQNQATCGPTFADLTEDVLTEVFLSSRGKKN